MKIEKISYKNIDMAVNQFVNKMLSREFYLQPWNSPESDVKNLYEKYYGKKITITYSFEKNHYHYFSVKYLYFFEHDRNIDIYPVSDIIEKKEPFPRLFNKSQRKQAKLAMQSWSDVANINFKKHIDDSLANMSFLICNKNNEFTARAFLPNNHKYSPIYFNEFNKINKKIALSSLAGFSLIHEIGHVLGLEHTFGDSNNTFTWSISVVNKNMPDDKNIVFPSTPLLADILSVQKLYGKNRKTRIGNTVYGFNSNTYRDFLTINNKTQNIIFCVWDAGGEDTFDFSGYDDNQLINLNERKFSSVGKLEDNVSIADGVTIENAIGGSGHDVIIGNPVRNKITGGDGADILTGGVGSDIFVYKNINDSTYSAADIITDFESDIDKIDVSKLIKNENELHFVDYGYSENDSGKTELLQDYHEVENLTYLIFDFGEKGVGEDLVIKLDGKHRLSINDFIFANSLSPAS